MDCCCQQIVEVRECTAVDCPLHPYRMGMRPVTLAKYAAAKAQDGVLQNAHERKVAHETRPPQKTGMEPS